MTQENTQDALKGKKIRKIAGIKVALTPGQTYSISRPGNFKGPMKIFKFTLRGDRTPVRGETVLSADIPSHLRQRFFDEFPSSIPW